MGNLCPQSGNGHQTAPRTLKPFIAFCRIARVIANVKKSACSRSAEKREILTSSPFTSGVRHRHASCSKTWPFIGVVAKGFIPSPSDGRGKGEGDRKQCVTSPSYFCLHGEGTFTTLSYRGYTKTTPSGGRFFTHRQYHLQYILGKDAQFLVCSGNG